MMNAKETIDLHEKFISWCEKTTFHAIPNIATNKQTFLKLMWMFCLLVSVGYCCRVLTISVTDYWNYPVLTTYDIVQESSASFPVVTVCGFRHANSSTELNMTSSNMSFSDHHYSHAGDYHELRKLILSCSFSDVCSLFCIILNF